MTKKILGVLLFGVPSFSFATLTTIVNTFGYLTAAAKQTHTSNIYNVFFDRSISFFLLLGLLLEKINCTILLSMLLKTEATAKIFLVKVEDTLNLLMTGFGSICLIAYFHHHVNFYPVSGSSIDAVYLGIVLLIFAPLLIFQLFVTSLRKAKKRSKKPNSEE